MLKGGLRSSDFSPSVALPALPRPHPLLTGLSSLADPTVVGGQTKKQEKEEADHRGAPVLESQLDDYSSDQPGDSDDERWEDDT